MDYADIVRGKDHRSLARLISTIENDPGKSREIISSIYDMTGSAEIIGMTGPPGAGKSTLLHKVALGYRARGKTVGIIAVDPTSPFTGGALLGDRIRMPELAADPGVFMRSLGSRGYHGGLSRAVGDVIRILDAAGFDVLLIESVGAGQGEVDIFRNVRTSILVTVPGLGDDVQALKAGIMEIGDIFVVNKADRDGADQKIMELEGMIELDDASSWHPPVVPTQALFNKGIEELLQAIDEHEQYLATSGEDWEREQERSAFFLRDALHQEVEKLLKSRIDGAQFERMVDSISKRVNDPHSAARALLDEILDQ